MYSYRIEYLCAQQKLILFTYIFVLVTLPAYKYSSFIICIGIMYPHTYNLLKIGLKGMSHVIYMYWHRFARIHLNRIWINNFIQIFV